MTEYHTLTPAYGRDYISKASAKEGLRSGQDFIYASPTATIDSTHQNHYRRC